MMQKMMVWTTRAPGSLRSFTPVTARCLNRSGKTAPEKKNTESTAKMNSLWLRNAIRPGHATPHCAAP